LSATTLPFPPKRRRSRGALGDAVFAHAARGAGLVVLALLGAIIVSLAVGGSQVFVKFGVLGFLLSADWDPVHQVFGALVPVVGTLATSLLAIIIAVPLAFGIAVTLTELAPEWIRRPVGIAIELLAAIPSIIFGMWGFFVVVPVMSGTVQPFLTDQLGDLPIIGILFQGAPFGTGVLTASVILAIMILPFIAATMRDVFATVPAMYKESAYGLGCTTWEVMRSIVLPSTRTAVAGGIMLGLGRALGETMAVTFVVGNADRLPDSLYSGTNTIASLVALEFAESQAGSLKLSALLALGLILFAISFLVLAISRLMLRPRGGH
jgi:phosphate transport system permease protein